VVWEEQELRVVDIDRRRVWMTSASLPLGLISWGKSGVGLLDTVPSSTSISSLWDVESGHFSAAFSDGVLVLFSLIYGFFISLFLVTTICKQQPQVHKRIARIESAQSKWMSQIQQSR
jgi:hypothetical protein